MPPCIFPSEITVLERGWLSANSIVFIGKRDTAVVDTGYFSHAAQTVDLVRNALNGRPLHRILNTHLHSDHCGGNAALQQAWPGVHTAIPPGQVHHIDPWDAYALGYIATGQHCPPFYADSTLKPQSLVTLGDKRWEIHAAPGHDPHSVVFFEPQLKILISADALWENGFGVVFPELSGEAGFADVAATLDVIEQLHPWAVIPGHGPMFFNAAQAIVNARRRLDTFVQDPTRHATHAAKVLIKYKLLEWQQVHIARLHIWAKATPYLSILHARFFSASAFIEWINSLADDLAHSGAALRQGDLLCNVE